MKLFRNQPFLRFLAVYVILTHIFQLCFPIKGYALTSGPSTPEVSGFSPIGATERVNLFTGDFSENIPLLDIEGYPLNISYSSGIGMDQEASCVGLGWSINPGNIYRNMRGLPDDFKGDSIKQEFNMRPNTSLGITAGAELELFGKALGKKQSNSKKIDSLRFSLNPSFGISYNNYIGFGLSVGVNPTFMVSRANGPLMTTGLGVAASSTSGLSFTPSFSYSRLINKEREKTVKVSVSKSINSRAGLQALSFGLGYSQYYTFKNVSKKAGLNGGSSLSFATPTYTPATTFPFNSFSLNLNFKTGWSLFGLFTNLNFQGYYSHQKLKHNEESNPAFGYIYAEETVGKKTALMDFNREKDGVFIKNTTTNLALANLTYDTYMASGQGVSGMFRPHRSSPGIVHDKEVIGGSLGLNGGVELGAGGLLHGGANIGGNWTRSYSGNWSQHDNLKNNFKFTGKSSSEPEYESVYFKNAGEKTSQSAPTFYANLGDEYAVRPQLSKQVLTRPKVENAFENKYGSVYSNSSYTRSKRDKRNQVFSWLNAEDAKSVGLETTISSYTENTGYNGNNQLPKTLIDRTDTNRKAHHMSQIEVTRPDGMRYFYGFPVYNTKKKEVSFSVADSFVDCRRGLVEYNPGTDNSINNTEGQTNYFNSLETPGYAYSYLLTAIVSDNYIDKDGIEGPSDGDFGNWHKINYSRIDSLYRWRTPFQKDQANYDEGFKTDNLDDKANYVYGEKEITYVHSIESRHYIALFNYSERLDGYGVVDENGGLDAGKKLRKLDKITLYSKNDLKENGVNAFPIKTVHLRYDYSLCKGIPNNINFGNAGKPDSLKGKLTLKKLFFTYGDSKQAALSPYEFHYADVNFDSMEDPEYNPDYNLKGYDRWGNYMPNDSCANNDLPNPEFPYVDQKPISQSNPKDRMSDVYAQAWHLHWMKLPSGGILKISYESDDYAYVQHKTAMQMVKVRGVGNSPTGTEVKHLINPSDKSNNNYIFLDLPIEVSSDQDFKDRYLKGLVDTSWIYFNFFTRITADSSEYEYVPGFVQIEDAGKVSSSVGWIKVKEVGIRDNDSGTKVQPMAKAAWNFVRMNLPWKVFKGQSPQGTGQASLTGLLGFGKDFKTFFKGFNRTLRKDKFGTYFEPAKSWIRLTTPDGMKHGGGLRVTKIELNDRWDQMSNGQERDYGQEFTYHTVGCQGDTISSGVAAYEPILGGEENPFRSPRFLEKRNMLALNDESFQTFPYGEFAFPAPIVGYSAVQVSSLKNPNVTRNSTGYVENKFYTARDYPTITSETIIDAKPKPANPLAKFLGWSKDHMTASQGYVIKRNDMHGKARSTKTYSAEKPGAITGVEYYYRSKRAYEPCPSEFSSFSVPNQLDNKDIPIIFPDGTHGTSTLGVDIEMVVDMREQESETHGLTASGNLDAFWAVLFPLASFTLWPSYIHEQTRFRSAVATKVVDTYGILERTVAIDNGAKVETKNLAYDAETGNALVTQTENEFKDDIYGLAQPAHWAYSGMGSAYKNVGLEINGPSISLSNITNAGDYFHPGDELLLENATGGTEKAWVMEVTSSSIRVVDEGGKEPPGTFKRIQVIRSGRRNLQSLSIGSISSQKNPLSYSTVDSLGKVISAGAIEYNDHWQTFCGDSKCGCASDTSSHGTPLYNMLKALVDGNRFVQHEQQVQACAFSFNQKAPSYEFLKSNSLSSATDFWGLNSSVQSGITAMTYNPTTGDYYVVKGCGALTIIEKYTRDGLGNLNYSTPLKTIQFLGVYGAAFDDANQKLYIAGIAPSLPNPNPDNLLAGQHLYEVDLSTGSLTYKAPIATGIPTSLFPSGNCQVPAEGLVNAMAFDDVSGQIYAIIRDIDNGNIINNLVKFSPNVGINQFTTLSIYPMGNYDMSGISFEPGTNHLIGVDFPAPTDTSWVYHIPIIQGTGTYFISTSGGSYASNNINPVKIAYELTQNQPNCLTHVPIDTCNNGSQCVPNILIRLDTFGVPTTFPVPSLNNTHMGSSSCTTRNAIIRIISNGTTPDSCEVGLSIADPDDSFQEIDHFFQFGIYPNAGDSCSPSNHFWVKGKNAAGTDTIHVDGFASCFPLQKITIPKAIGTEVNPYCEGIKGNWRPLRSHAYLTDRTTQNTITSTTTDIRNEGFYEQFNPFWKAGNPWAPQYTNWTWASEVSQITPYGQEIENRDALDRYSAALFGYGHQLPIAIAGNAHAYEIANANFEIEDEAILTCNAHTPFTLNYTTELTSFISSDFSHSGYQSAFVGDDGGYISAVFGITQSDSTVKGGNIPYKINTGDCLGEFRPVAGKRYVASVWVYSTAFSTTDSLIFDYPDSEILIYVDQLPILNPVSEKRSKIIEGWQQIEVIFDISSNAQYSIDFRLKNNHNKYACYFDDFRVHPYDAHMQTHVYDPVTQRLLASGDANNYMMFYSYDHEGKLIGTQVETNRGIKSLNEARSHAAKP